jgi:hypothetical protein
MSLLQYRLVVGACVPVILAIMGILGKKIVRGRGWRRSDFYLGIELTLAGVAAALTSLFEMLLKPAPSPTLLNPNVLLGEIILLFVGMFCFMSVISLHQDFEDRNNTGWARKREIQILAGVANTVGFMVLLVGGILMAG